uniref:Uncharacterized protein n=1 Tax=Macaca nemestrina TaxID=9545 RepID=A0A2K6AZF9_MACNE
MRMGCRHFRLGLSGDAPRRDAPTEKPAWCQLWDSGGAGSTTGPSLLPCLLSQNCIAGGFLQRPCNFNGSD